MTLSPLWGPKLRVQQQPAKERAPASVAERASVSVPSVFAPSAPVEKAKPRTAVENLTTADVVGLSVESVNLLVRENPKLVAQLVINAGKMRRAELPTPMASLRPMARCILLAGMKRRAEQISDADEEFLAAFCESIAAA
jgi:hypothetical protein